jgi:hypothetical protein
MGRASWRILPTPPTGAGISADFTSVSCASRDYCIAVGATAGPKDNESKPLVELWDGATWRVETSPLPPGQSAFYGVSCAAVADCVAIGAFSANGDGHMLVERLTRT